MINHLPARVAFLWALAFATPASGTEPARVIATIKPIHSLVAAVMQGAGTPRLLIGSGASPHAYSLKPSDARALQNADVIFWVGRDLETFLEKPLTALPKTARVVELAAAPGMTLLHSRTNDFRDEPLHAEGTDHPGSQGGSDMHVWLDADNARAIVRATVAALIAADPDRAEVYRGNGERTETQIVALDHALRSESAPLAGRPYIVFHDAYRYLEHRYGLTRAGSITMSPERQPSARRIAAIRARIANRQAVCIFSEPQFDPALLKTVIEGTSIRVGVLDAEGGIEVPPGPEAYFAIMR
ncbi:MAG: zinc ABC transporter substrate-binding protein, partial [Rhodoplanes sp.]